MRAGGGSGLKRLFDVVVVVIALPLLIPLCMVVAFVVLISLGRPVLFAQNRGGLGGSVIRLWKFRTMTDDRDPKGELLPDEQRITRLGGWLRESSLDELPGFFSVLKGDLSLVGPRPFVATYLQEYSDFEARRHEVRPGITGWAQVNGRNALSWQEKFALDVWYVDNATFWLDIRILIKTALMVLRREGINGPGAGTVDAYVGKSNRGTASPEEHGSH
jgi:sugar transferase EpsL